MNFSLNVFLFVAITKIFLMVENEEHYAKCITNRTLTINKETLNRHVLVVYKYNFFSQSSANINNFIVVIFMINKIFAYKAVSLSHKN